MSYAERFFLADGTFRSPELAALHATIIQGGFSTPAIEAERMLADGGLGATVARDWLYEEACKLCTCAAPNAAGRTGPHHRRDCPQWARKLGPMPGDREERATCAWCGGDAVIGTVCPKSLPCPTCKVAPGVKCKRPSGHAATQLHAARIAAAEDPPSGGREG